MYLVHPSGNALKAEPVVCNQWTYADEGQTINDLGGGRAEN